MRLKGIVLLVSCVSFGLGVPLQRTGAETIMKNSTTYFSVGGKTADDLDRELVRSGPVSRVTGKRHPGATQIKFTGAATFVEKKGRCYIGGAKVKLITKVMLPRWKNRAGATKIMGLIWDTMSSDIKRHELRHVEIARNNAKKLEKEILALGPLSNCDRLKGLVSKISQKAMAEHDREQRQFDRSESANYEKRMIRLLEYRKQARASGH